MTIKANHRHVDMQGCIYLPYLHEWAQSSDLNGLIEIASNVFSFDPPLFTKPAGSAATQPVVTNPYASAAQTYATNPVAGPTNVATLTAYPSNTSSRPVTVVTGNVISSNMNAMNNMNTMNNPVNTSAMAMNTPVTNYGYSSNPNPNPTNTYGLPATSASAGLFVTNNNNINNSSNNNMNSMNSMSSQKAAQEKHDHLLMEVTSKIQQEIYRHQQDLKKDLDREFANAKYLDKSSETLSRGKQETATIVSQLESALLTVKEKENLLKEWDSEQSTRSRPEVEELIFSYDDLSNQILKLNAESNAIDDLLYFLEKRLMNHKLDLNNFLKESRQLARRQFMCKAHLMKIQAQLAALMPQQQQPFPSSSGYYGNPNQSPPDSQKLGQGQGRYGPPPGASPSHMMIHPQQQVTAQYPGMGTPVGGPFIHSMNQHAANRSQVPYNPPLLPGDLQQQQYQQQQYQQQQQQGQPPQQQPPQYQQQPPPQQQQQSQGVNYAYYVHK